MSINLICGVCGGENTVSGREAKITCAYCGLDVPVPMVREERTAKMYNRANEQRMMKEFDIARMAYEQIILENPDDAEAYWGAAICRFGVEYVLDPASGVRKPTLHRMQYDSILSDENYKTALKKADEEARVLYERDAKLIDNIQKKYLYISLQESPFDIFICYKDTDTNDKSSRTSDSVYAEEIYSKLTELGYKVFFSRVTLRSKLGQAYEPYIFASLNSAKIMLVVGTSAEHMMSIWVKNEWERFLYLKANVDSSKTLIPVFRDMRADELPQAFARFQSQDMGRIGAMHDLLRGVRAILPLRQAVPTADPAQSVRSAQAAMPAGDARTYYLRAMVYLEDGDTGSARRFLENGLNVNPEYAPIFIARLLIQYGLTEEQELAGLDKPYENSNDWQRALRFATPEQKATYEGYYHAKQSRRKYALAAEALRTAKTAEQFTRAEAMFTELMPYSDAEAQARVCREKREVIATAGRSVLYSQALLKLTQAASFEDYRQAEEVFRALIPYSDAEARAEACRAKQEEAYINACRQMHDATDAAGYARAATMFQRLSWYRDSEELLKECQIKKRDKHARMATTGSSVQYSQALLKFTQAISFEDYRQAEEMFRALIPYSDAEARAEACRAKQEEAYINACRQMHDATDAAGYARAASMFQRVLWYRDSEAMVQECLRKKTECKDMALKKRLRTEADAKEREASRQAASKEFAAHRTKQEKTYPNVNETGRRRRLTTLLIFLFAAAIIVGSRIIVPSNSYKNAEKLLDEGAYSIAVQAFEALGDHSDAADRLKDTRYLQAESFLKSGDYKKAIASFSNLFEYRSGLQRAWTLRYQYAVPAEISAGTRHTVGLRRDGTVVACGSDDFSESGGGTGQTEVGAWTDIVAVAAGGWHTVGLKADGTVVAVGMNDNHRTDVGSWKNITAIAAGNWHTVGLRKDGTVVAVGDSTYASSNVGGFTNIVAIAAGGYHTVGLRADGTVTAVGDNGKGQTNVGGWDDIIAIAAGGYHTVGLRKDGTVVAAGDGSKGQTAVEDWKDIVAIAAGRYFTVGLTTEGRVVAVGDNQYGQTNVSGWSDIITIAAGGYHTIGLQANGKPIAVGKNTDGQDKVTHWTKLGQLALD